MIFFVDPESTTFSPEICYDAFKMLLVMFYVDSQLILNHIKRTKPGFAIISN